MTNSNGPYAPTLGPHVLEILQTQYWRVQPLPAAEIIWRRHMSAEDREHLGGDFEQAYVQGGTVGMWKRLRGVSGERALVEVAHLLGFLSGPNMGYLLRELGELPAETPPIVTPRSAIPVWNRETGQLKLKGQIIREVKNPGRARNIVAVLEAFEEEGWPTRIYDPLPGGQNRQRLYRTISSLNEGLHLICFHADGTSQGFTWRHHD